MHCIRSFKLLLHPQELSSASHIQVPPLPPHIDLKTVYKDFIGYAFGHAMKFFQDTLLDGVASWARLSSSFELVFAIPNGWTEAEQGFIHDAVLAACILPPHFAVNRLAFVSEAEASVHFALDDMDFAPYLTKGKVLRAAPSSTNGNEQRQSVWCAGCRSVVSL